MSFRGQGSQLKMMLPRGRLDSTGVPHDQKVNKAEELIYLSTNIARTYKSKKENLN
jgi:hypothetical protein